MSKFNMKFRPDRNYGDDYAFSGKRKNKADKATLRHQKECQEQDFSKHKKINVSDIQNINNGFLDEELYDESSEIYDR